MTRGAGAACDRPKRSPRTIRTAIGADLGVGVVVHTPAIYRPRTVVIPIPPPPPPVITPCIGVCQLDTQGLCEGCLRSGAEIAAWSTMTHAQRLHWIEQVQPQRERLRQ